jgi:hypothetical protein
MNDVALINRLDALDKRIAAMERGAFTSVKVANVTKREQNGLGAARQIVLEEHHVCDGDLALITRAEYAQYVETARKVQHGIDEISAKLSGLVELAAVANRKAEGADAVGVQVAEGLIELASALGIELGIDKETRRFQVLRGRADAVTALHLSQEVERLREERDQYRAAAGRLFAERADGRNVLHLSDGSRQS